jgi:hypothetical protein
MRDTPRKAPSGGGTQWWEATAMDRAEAAAPSIKPLENFATIAVPQWFDSKLTTIAVEHRT